METCDEVWAHNALFDRNVLKRCPELPQIPMEKWRCMMVRAYLHGLPGKLEKLTDIFKLGEEGKVDGQFLMRMFCIPKADGPYNEPVDFPLEWDLFVNWYAAGDILSMRALDSLIPHWNSTDELWHLYHLDQWRNDAGFAVDIDLAEKCLIAVTEESKRLAERTQELTMTDAGPAVEKATQRDKLLQYLLGEYGVTLPDLRADTIERRLEDPELPEMVKELLRIRLKATKASTAKYKRVIESQVGGRLRGTVQHRGAQRTGRDAGRIFQPQNLPRLSEEAVAAFYLLDDDGWQAIPKKERAGLVAGYMDKALTAFKEERAQLMLGDGVMASAANLLRGVIIAGPNTKLVVSDLANIEGRKLAWLAGEGWKLQMFRDFDAKKIKYDNYVLAYARAFGVAPEIVDDFMRQIGKVMELALGYQGGVGAFATMAVTYGIDLDDMAERAWDSIPDDVMAASRAKYYKALENTRKGLGMAERAWIVCQALVTLWRNAHPATVKYWWQTENAAKSATANPGRVFQAGYCRFEHRGNWLRCRLPSGRLLCYPSARLEDGQLSYAGVNQYTRQWSRIYTYAGKLVENIDQASSADVLKHGEKLAWHAGYRCVLPVHDELVTEVPDDDSFSEAALSGYLATVPAWADGLPLAAKGFEAYRYKKG